MGFWAGRGMGAGMAPAADSVGTFQLHSVLVTAGDGGGGRRAGGERAIRVPAGWPGGCACSRGIIAIIIIIVVVIIMIVIMIVILIIVQQNTRLYRNQRSRCVCPYSCRCDDDDDNDYGGDEGDQYHV